MQQVKCTPGYLIINGIGGGGGIGGEKTTSKDELLGACTASANWATMARLGMVDDDGGSVHRRSRANLIYNNHIARSVQAPLLKVGHAEHAHAFFFFAFFTS